MYRALWLNACATEDELNRFIEKDEIRQTLAELAEAIDPAHNSTGQSHSLRRWPVKGPGHEAKSSQLALGCLPRIWKRLEVGQA
jgi:hypothetical protein